MDPRREDAIHNERFVKIVCVGTGFSGLCLAYKLRRSKEIKSYLEGFATKYDLWKHIRTCHRATETSWDPAKGQWVIAVADVRTGTVVRDTCHILVHATGYLSKPACPSAPGLDKMFYSSGRAASSVQILPAIQPVVKSVKVFIRTP
ncbi:hypothetical protein VTK56DRAFT_4343 [Thermocarpiscus australiensis]